MGCDIMSIRFHSISNTCSRSRIVFLVVMFNNVVVFWVRDEPNFFDKISHSFSSLRRLTISDKQQQKDKSEGTSSIIEFSHLIELSCGYCHTNYIEQFLSDLNTRLPSFRKLRIQYEDLVTITENFRRHETRANYAKLKSITFSGETTMVHSKDFYLYFPSL